MRERGGGDVLPVSLTAVVCELSHREQEVEGFRSGGSPTWWCMWPAGDVLAGGDGGAGTTLRQVPPPPPPPHTYCTSPGHTCTTTLNATYLAMFLVLIGMYVLVFRVQLPSWIYISVRGICC